MGQFADEILNVEIDDEPTFKYWGPYIHKWHKSSHKTLQDPSFCWWQKPIKY